MNIAQIKGLDIGMSGISCSGVVKYEKEPRNIAGTRNGNPYSFWSQFIVLEDETDSIGVNLRLDKADQRREKNQIVSVEKGVLDSYEKDGETKLSLKGNLTKASASQQGQQGPQQSAGRLNAQNAANDPSTMRIVRGNALNAVMSAIEIPADAVEQYLLAGVQWILAGKWVVTPPNTPGYLDEGSQEPPTEGEIPGEIPF